MTGPRLRGLLPWALGGEALYIALAAAPKLRTHLPLFFALFLSAGLLTAAAAFRARDTDLRLILAFAALYRATLLAKAPDLSDDIYRYIWDGHVGLAGISPYAYAPDDPRLLPLRGPLWEKVAHRDARTVYPPVAQTVFRAAAIIGTSPAVLKTVVAAADLGAAALLARLVPLGEVAAVTLYAWHPLPVFFSAGEGHIDSVGVALLLAALLCLRRRRAGISGAAFALSLATKYLPASAAAPLARAGGWRWAGAAVGMGLACFSLALSWGASPFGGLSDYAERWEFNSPAYEGARALMVATELPGKSKQAFIRWKEGHQPDPPWAQKIFPLFYDGLFARLLLGILALGALSLIALRVREPVSGTYASLAALLLLAPTLYPWYLLWVLPLAALRREPAFLYLATVSCLSMAILYPTPLFSKSAVMLIEFVPFAVLLLWGYLGRRTTLNSRLSTLNST